jgi:hypothetical protein
VRAPTDFYNGHDALQLTLERDIPLHDDRVGEKCRAVRAKTVHLLREAWPDAFSNASIEER